MESAEQVKRRFGAWIKEKREATRLSQDGAAKRAGIDRQQWYRIESGLSGTRRDTVIAMANALTVSVPEALHIAGFASDESEADDGLFSGLKKLSPRDQKLARRQIQAILDSFVPNDEDEGK